MSLTMNILTLSNNIFLSKQKRRITFGTVEMAIAFFVLLQCIEGDKSSRNVSICEFSNSAVVIGKFTFDNIY